MQTARKNYKRLKLVDKEMDDIESANGGVANCINMINLAISGLEANLSYLKEHAPSDFFLCQKKIKDLSGKMISKFGF